MPCGERGHTQFFLDYPLVPNLRLGTQLLEAPLREHGDAKQSFATVRPEAELGNEDSRPN